MVGFPLYEKLNPFLVIEKESGNEDECGQKEGIEECICTQLYRIEGLEVV